MNTVVLILNFVCNLFLLSYRKIVDVEFSADITVLRYLKPQSGYENACLSMWLSFSLGIVVVVVWAQGLRKSYWADFVQISTKPFL